MASFSAQIAASSAILAFNEKDAVLPDASACIRCGRCVSICPASLNPTAIDRAMEESDPDTRYAMLKDAGVQQCIECACCAYVCPAHRPIMEVNQKGYSFVRSYERAKKEAAK